MWSRLRTTRRPASLLLKFRQCFFLSYDFLTLICECSTFKLSFYDENNKLTLVSFKYLGHIIDNFLHDDLDIAREIECMFTRTNILIRRFSKSFVTVKKKLFTTFCMCFYDVALWANFTTKVHFLLQWMHESVFGYRKLYSSVTNMLLELGLPSFNTVIHNAKVKFTARTVTVRNSVISTFW